MLESAPNGGRARIDGQIRAVPLAWKTCEVPFADKPRFAMTIPWGDVASAYYSTAIPNIEVYAAASRRQVRSLNRLKMLLPALSLPLVQRLIVGFVDRYVSGPTEHQRHKARGEFWGRASDDHSASVEATLSTPGGYELTIHTAVTALEQVLAGRVSAGFATPSQAFGREFILQFPGVALRWQSATGHIAPRDVGANRK
jgi:short subunit dehydrogenase-like uncharacterized protein